MELTRKQEEGLKIAISRYQMGEKYTTIAGYAGTGKSTLVRFIIEALGVNEEDVCYATFTGKAAEVLRKKGNPNAVTLHHLLYEYIPQKDGSFLKKERFPIEYKIIVVDEVSMVPLSMIKQLLRHPVYILFLGDPFQLPQIDTKEAHDLLDCPHIFLDEIMRQAAESEIIQLTMKIREGSPIPYFNGSEVKVIPKSELVTGCLTWADQIICATNNTRESLNRTVRSMLGFSGLPKTGEKIICLRNYWDLIPMGGAEDALVNGTTGTIQNPFDNFQFVPKEVRCPVRKLEYVTGDFITDTGSHFPGINMDKKLIMTGQRTLNDKEAYYITRAKKKHGDLMPKEFAFGYAITAWKAQGSEWDKVLAIEESFPFDEETHARYLYTVCTRASKKLVLVKN